MDELSSMNLSGAAAKPLAGENDLAQNPFDVGAEYGPSLFDARHRFVASASGSPACAHRRRRRSALSSAAGRSTGSRRINSGTPFTVSDSANVSLQANSPPISGFPASRPNLVGDPNDGPHTVDQWISRVRRSSVSNPLTQAGQFGNAPRNIARADGYFTLDVSLVRNFALTDGLRLQFRAESFNVTNHPNFGIPVADLNSANFGRVFSAAPPRLLQFALKLMF